MEELGEVAEEIRKSSGDKERKDIEVDLEGEIGDLLMPVVTIANYYDIVSTKAVSRSMSKIKERHAKWW